MAIFCKFSVHMDMKNMPLQINVSLVSIWPRNVYCHILTPVLCPYGNMLNQTFFRVFLVSRKENESKIRDQPPRRDFLIKLLKIFKN